MTRFESSPSIARPRCLRYLPYVVLRKPPISAYLRVAEKWSESSGL